MFTDLSLGWFVLFGILGSFGDVPGLTAREALLLPVARRSTWTIDRLVGLCEGMAAIAMAIGPAAAAGLVRVLDGPAALWVTAGLSLVAALVTLVLPRDVGVWPSACCSSARCRRCGSSSAAPRWWVRSEAW
jgi:hypothetical protein